MLPSCPCSSLTPLRVSEGASVLWASTLLVPQRRLDEVRFARLAGGASSAAIKLWLDKILKFSVVRSGRGISTFRHGEVDAVVTGSVVNWGRQEVVKLEADQQSWGRGWDGTD